MAQEHSGARRTLAEMAGPEVIGIVGAGLAGGRAAAALREHGFNGRVVLIGDEADLPYERPPLSKAYLLGQLPRARLLLRPAQYYLDQGIELRLNTVGLELEPRRRRLRLDDGSELGYHRLLLATGSTPRHLDLPGAGLEGVMSLRTLPEADRLRGLLQSRPRVVVLGAGFLGCELAAAARTSGCPVRMVELGGSALPSMGAEIGEFVVGLHRRHGVEIEFQRSAVEFQGDRRVEAVVLDDGLRLPCDLALVCVGSQPNSELALAAGLEVADGVLVDRDGRSSDPAIFAAGDLASVWDPGLGRRLRLEHWDSAQRQGAHTAATMLGIPDARPALPYFWSEQYDAMIQQVGLVSPAQAVVVRGRPADNSFSVFHLEDGAVAACVAVNRFPDLAAARRLIPAGVPVDPDVLGDPGTDLRQLAATLSTSA